MADTELDVMEPLPQPARRPISHKPWTDVHSLLLIQSLLLRIAV